MSAPIPLPLHKSMSSIAHLVMDQLAATRQITQNYGTSAALGMPGGKKRTILHFAHADLAAPVFKNFKDFGNGGVIVASDKGSKHNILRSGYFRANGQEYDHYVRKIGPHFKRGEVDKNLPLIFQTVSKELDGWHTGQTINFTSEVGVVLKKLASRCMFKDPDEAKGTHAADMVEQHGRLSGVSPKNLVMPKLSKRIRRAMNLQGERTYDALVNWALTRKGLGTDRDLLSAIVNSDDERGCPVTRDRMAGYGWTMLGATYDTSTSILSWLMLQLALHPQVLDTLCDELDALDPQSDDYAQQVMKAPYLEAVINEALRLVPPAPVQRRKALRDTHINELEVQKGTEVLLSAWMINRDADIYPDPENFDPSRWENLKVSPFQWPSFSAGPRRCLGIWFAYGFLKAIMAEMLNRWRPTIPDGTKIDMRVKVTVRPDPFVPVHLSDRHTRPTRPNLTGNYTKYLYARD